MNARKEPSSFKGAMQDPDWCETMKSKLDALEENVNWEITTFPVGKTKSLGSK